MSEAVFLPSVAACADVVSRGGIALFASDDRYLLFSLKQLVRSVYADAGDTELVELDAEDSPNALKEGLGLAGEIGFFSSRRVIVIDHLSVSKEGDQKALEAYLASPEPNNTVIVLFSALDKRTSFYKKIKKSKYFNWLPAVSSAEKEQFIIARFAPLTPARELVERLLKDENDDLFFIAAEIEKMVLFAYSHGLDNGPLTSENMSPVLSSLSDEIIFGIMEKLCLGNKEEALAHYRTLLRNDGANKVNPVIIGMLQRHFAFLSEIDLSGRNRHVTDAMRTHKVWYLRRILSSYLATVTSAKVTAGMELTARLELGMKGVRDSKVPELSIGIEQVMLHLF